jgi:hypothetical protein
MVGWTWVKRYQAMLDEYTKEIAHEASQQLMNEAVTIGKIGTNHVEGTDGNGQAVQIIVNPAGWGVVKVHVRRGSQSKEWKMELAGTDPKMIAGQAIYKSGLF